MHTDFITDLINSNYQNTANWVLVDNLIEPEYLEGSEAESPGTYVWVADNKEVLYIGEYGFTVKYRMNQHWASWPRTTRSNQKEPDHKKQKGDIIYPHLKQGKTVKIFSKPATIVHLQCPHPLRSFQTDVPDMLRMDTKSYEEAMEKIKANADDPNRITREWDYEKNPEGHDPNRMGQCGQASC